MPWFRLEDSFDTHPKTMAAGNEAIGLFIRCGTYSARHLTDGFVPRDVVAIYSAGNASLAATLVRVGLWHKMRTGYSIHDYLDFNPSREAVERERQQKAERQARWRKSRGRDHSETQRNTGTEPVDNAYRDAQNGVSAGQNSMRRRVTNASRDASKDGAPPRPAPKEAGRGGHPPRRDANGRASPPGSPARVATSKPPWCGRCDELTRQTGDPPARCPACHPLEVAKETS